MIAKQKNIRTFHIKISDEESFFSYMKKNIVLLKDYFLVIDGNITENIISYLKEEGVCFKEINDCNINIFSKTSLKNRYGKINNNDLKNSKENTNRKKPLVFDRPIRSGEEIVSEESITIFSRVNSGAKVISESNVEIYGIIDGIVQCDGDYMIVKDIGSGNIIFNGLILEKDNFDGNLKKIFKSEDSVEIKDIN